VKPKRVISPADAAAPPESLKKEQVWTFKKWRPADPVRFADGTEFRFPLQKLRTGGYDTSSTLDVSDPELAEKLKQVIEAGETSLVEIDYGD
jgi:hypothetical protein